MSSLSVSVTVYVSVCLFVLVSLSTSVFLSFCLCPTVSLSFCLFVRQSLCLSLSLPISVSVSRCSAVSLLLYLCLCVFFVALSTCPTVSLSRCLHVSFIHNAMMFAYYPAVTCRIVQSARADHRQSSQFHSCTKRVAHIRFFPLMQTEFSTIKYKTKCEKRATRLTIINKK